MKGVGLADASLLELCRATPWVARAHRRAGSSPAPAVRSSLWSYFRPREPQKKPPRRTAFYMAPARRLELRTLWLTVSCCKSLVTLQPQNKGVFLSRVELQQELERVEGRLFWLVERRNKIRGFINPFQNGLIENSSRRIWSRKEGRHLYNVLIGFWAWVGVYCIWIGHLAWWAWDLIAYGPGENLGLELEMGFVVIGATVLLTRFIFTAPEIRPRNLRYFHYTPADQRPAMREKLEAERAVLLERLAKV